MMETPRYIRNHEAVFIPAYGDWPTFHDTPILAFEHTDDCIALALCVSDLVLARDEDGPCQGFVYHIVRFAFHGIIQTDLAQFNPANNLSEMTFSATSEFNTTGHFMVRLGSAMLGDLYGSFTATSGEVTAVLPCDERGQLA